MRVLHYRQNNGQLDGIEAVLGCPVVMPDFDIEDLDTNQVKQVADCFFHCINWFREILSAFVTMKISTVRTKVIKRLKVIFMNFYNKFLEFFVLEFVRNGKQT